MTEVVCDASAGVDALLGSGRSTAVRGLLRGVAHVHVPELFAVEVVAALRRRCLTGGLAPARAERAIAALDAFAAVAWPHSGLLTRTWDLRANISTYDAVYVALAERLDAALLTTDERLAAAVAAHTPVEIVALD